MDDASGVAVKEAGTTGYGLVSGDTHGEWRIRCQDILNRDRSVAVFVRSGRVLLVGPPGETAVLSLKELDELRTALEEASNEAER